MTLPIDAYLSQIETHLRAHPNLILVAEPGAGKTTHVPRLLAESIVNDPLAVWVLQPRRLAARLAAGYVASQWDGTVGQRVGYRVRFDDATSARTRLVYMTEGIMIRALLDNATLPHVGAVVFDEFHGRTLASDTALAALRHVQRTTRPDLRLVVMSATLDVAPIAAQLDHPPQVQVPGRLHPVAIEHVSHRDTRPLETQVAHAVTRLLGEVAHGDMLVFLPGMPEIRRAIGALQALSTRAGVEVLPLHGSLSPAEQERAVRRSERRKIILATNVAETSVTLPAVTAVVDSGLARILSHDAWTGMSTLQVRPISQSAATQRAGRAGRTQPGVCLRLYTRQDLRLRPSHEVPEILRLDLCETILLCRAMRLPPLQTLPWLDAPPVDAVNAGESLLRRLGALDVAGDITVAGQQMARLPVHPRLSRLMQSARERGVGRWGCQVAAWLSEARGTGASNPATGVGTDDFAAARQLTGSSRTLAEQLVRAMGLGRGEVASDPDAALAAAVLSAYPDRVARRVDVHSHNNLELLMCGGGRAQLAAESVVRAAEYLVAVEAQERRDAGRTRMMVSVAAAIAVEDLLGVPDGVTEVSQVSWNETAERVEAVQQLRYGALVLSEHRSLDVAADDADRADRLFMQAARSRGLQNLVDVDGLRRLLARLEVAAAADPALGEALGPDGMPSDPLVWAERACAGLRSFAELRACDPRTLVQAALPSAVWASVARLCPEHMTLSGGRRVEVHYDMGKPPWIESWLQDFFGSAEGPSIAGGRVPLTLHLLAPNRRAVQVTRDLAGFWERHYPALRKALSRRYPRHAWPDDPLQSTPPPPRRR